MERNNSTLNKDIKRNKLTLLDLENQTDKKLKEIENLLKGGVTDSKLQQLEDRYKDNKDIMDVIHKYKTKKYNIENTEDINSNLFNNNELKNASIQIINLDKYNNNKNIKPKIKDYTDLSPFYYISNGNKVSKNMWGYNDKTKYKNDRNNNLNNNNNKINLSKEEIIHNKLEIFKNKIYRPFLEKVEQEKQKEIKREQILKKINDPKIKENLETKYAMESRCLRGHKCAAWRRLLPVLQRRLVEQRSGGRDKRNQRAAHRSDRQRDEAARGRLDAALEGESAGRCRQDRRGNHQGPKGQAAERYRPRECPHHKGRGMEIDCSVYEGGLLFSS